jgi:hypothetical protein
MKKFLSKASMLLMILLMTSNQITHSSDKNSWKSFLWPSSETRAKAFQVAGTVGNVALSNIATLSARGLFVAATTLDPKYQQLKSGSYESSLTGKKNSESDNDSQSNSDSESDYDSDTNTVILKQRNNSRNITFRNKKELEEMLEHNFSKATKKVDDGIDLHYKADPTSLKTQKNLYHDINVIDKSKHKQSGESITINPIKAKMHAPKQVEVFRLFKENHALYIEPEIRENYEKSQAKSKQDYDRTVLKAEKKLIEETKAAERMRDEKIAKKRSEMAKVAANTNFMIKNARLNIEDERSTSPSHYASNESYQVLMAAIRATSPQK